ncbi:hypothetical protein TREMEDRAFT_31161 [Tremella mesenterica DSM 1558]|uniref:uncharacterized protein n=1 Tax=Tremella mesenterica (strain ATCC 24925 / CBS 8224 / DSM 1558 / NBRC 9311 / NRRL Y-6157 / RJB 2259-6 / UBC 559-6) TaxID=578456 RepID=UPI0003F4994A|nr:uncharacterized protein TREMEDRAFT_31161 [Tremella mesenterica DSM 1558]EIW68865.1 hypothetical protein TREMEDRAFT_31161 [Tremella mesenterica DSM 1558]
MFAGSSYKHLYRSLGDLRSYATERKRSTGKMFDTIVLGAGWSGAVTARDLAKKGYAVLVLEARDRVGGRARTWVGKGDTRIDIGCSFIHGYKEGNPTGYIAKELNVPAHLPKPSESLIYGPNGPLSKAQASSLTSALSAAQAAYKLPHPSPPPTASLASALLSPSSPLFTTSTTPAPSSDLNNTNPANPSLPSLADSTPATELVDPQLAKGLARTLELPLGVKLEKVSLKWAGWETITNFSGSDAAPEGGYQSLVEKVLEDAKSHGAKVLLNTKVISIENTNEGVKVITDEEIYQGKTVICTIPLGVLKTLPDDFFRPSLPTKTSEIIAGTHVGCLEKLLLRYPHAWWPKAEEVGSYTFLPTSTTSLSSTSTPKEIFEASSLSTASFATGSLPGQEPILLTYLSVDPATLLLKHPQQEVAKAFHEFLKERFGVHEEVPEPTEVIMTNWLTDEYARGATTTPSIISEHGERSPMDFKELGRPLWGGKLGFAGEHTEMEHRGSVAGAVISGQREAERVDRLLKL